jgi:hypothetical protein
MENRIFFGKNILNCAFVTPYQVLTEGEDEGLGDGLGEVLGEGLGDGEGFSRGVGTQLAHKLDGIISLVSAFKT